MKKRMLAGEVENNLIAENLLKEPAKYTEEWPNQDCYKTWTEEMDLEPVFDITEEEKEETVVPDLEPFLKHEANALFKFLGILPIIPLTNEDLLWRMLEMECNAEQEEESELSAEEEWEREFAKTELREDCKEMAYTRKLNIERVMDADKEIARRVAIMNEKLEIKNLMTH